MGRTTQMTRTLLPWWRASSHNRQTSVLPASWLAWRALWCVDLAQQMIEMARAFYIAVELVL
eukprot:364723-Chlamydomonas_euryale.AAC.12